MTTNSVPGQARALASGDDFPGNGPGFAKYLDKILRQREELFEEIFAGKEVGRLMRRLVLGTLLLSCFYGAMMGFMGIGQDVSRGLLQSVTSAFKVPFLYLLSVAVCFPVLYVVLVLMGVRLRFQQTLALILLALTLNSVLLASCAPIVFFFILTGADYDFVKLLHVFIFGFSGAWSMMSLWQGLVLMCEKSALYPRQAVRILQVWVLVFGFVGTQMAWSLRPFVGDPGMAYQLFRQGREGNFYKAVWMSAAGIAKKTSGAKPR
jgi:hypothetical protein